MAISCGTMRGGSKAHSGKMKTALPLAAMFGSHSLSLGRASPLVNGILEYSHWTMVEKASSRAPN